MIIEKNKSLKNYNTCKIDANADYFIVFNNDSDIKELSALINKTTKPIQILGLGANTLFTKNFKGTIIHINTKGIEITSEDSQHVYITVKAGEIWDDFVSFCIQNKYYGLENLVAIPSTIGAVPIQNIGAYGVEASSIIYEVQYLCLEDNKIKTIDNKSCKFAYRNSIFKQELKDKILITNVVFKLNKTSDFNIEYGQIQNEIKQENISEIKLDDIARIIKNIRSHKLPDYNTTGNAGSFFKNPIISIEKYNKLKKTFPNIVSYKVNEDNVKIAAGWLIDNAGLKSFSVGDAMVHENQALVIVNKGNASGEDFNKLSNHIQNVILEIYNIKIYPEVIIL